MNLKTKKKALLFALTMSMGLVHSQSSKMALSATGGSVQEGFGGKISFNYYNNDITFIKTSFMASFSNEDINSIIQVPYNIYTLNVGYFSKILKTKNDNAFLNIGGGASIGYENINGNSQDLSDGSLIISESSFVYGVFGGLDGELYLSDSFSFLMETDLIYHLGSDIGNVNAYIGIGFRYFFN